MSDGKTAQAQDTNRFRAIFVSEPECVKLIDRECRLIDMNPAGLRMIDAPNLEAVCGRSILDVIDAAYHEIFRDTVRAVFRGESTRIQFEVIGLKGRRLWMDQSAAPLFDPNDSTRVIEMVAVTRDVTAQREAEEALLQTQVSEELYRSKADFLSSISNELKTPLNHIIGYGELLQESARDEGRARDADDMQRILDAAARLLSMINQMLAVSLADARRHKVCLDECDLGVMVHDAVKSFAAAAEENANRIIVELPAERGLWSCDCAKIDQCLRCILSNAVKYTKNGVITVRAGGVVENDQSLLQIDIIDTGEGIAPDRLDAIFQPFSNVGVIDGQPAIGMGLAVTRQLARLIGGDVTVTSTPGEGSHFTLKAPAEFVPDAAFAKAG